MAGVVFAVGLLVNLNTNAWFSSSATAGAFFSSAATETIIEKFEVSKTNPESIKVKKAQDFSPNPIIYFAVEGEAANYVLHLNPVLLDTYREKEIIIETDLNLLQYLKLLFSSYDRVVEGKIKLKYLNEFIDEEKEILFTRDYLLGRFKEKIDRNEKDEKAMGVKLDSQVAEDKQFSSPETDTQVLELVTYVASQREWEEAQWFYEINLDQDAEPVIEGLKLTEGQSSLLDFIVPKLKEQIASLVSLLKEKTSIISEQLREISELTKTNLTLEEDKTNLEEENLLLKQQIEQLNQNINALNQERYYLEQQIGSLRRATAVPITNPDSGEAGEEAPEGAAEEVLEDEKEEPPSQDDDGPIGGGGDNGEDVPMEEDSSQSGDNNSDEGEGTEEDSQSLVVQTEEN